MSKVFGNKSKPPPNTSGNTVVGQPVGAPGGVAMGTPVGMGAPGAVAAGASTVGKQGMSAGSALALGAVGSYLLFTPEGGETAGNLTGQASSNIGNVLSNVFAGLQPLLIPVSISSSGILSIAMIFMAMPSLMGG
jgi:hypothetical protein